ncbi:hypothetical protein [Achromobacter spanius]|uniref:Uncharacterized protein n=1 Tax=Achromobacter spanius TaxID=217203 RepID=A0A2S0IDS4_9BURK|nr:hypothetical protein [Achromobacter spanius]AVJ30181.1 hypothetical protein CLM73_25480 [Achromobacter spanius]
MTLKFVSIVQPTEDSEFVDVKFMLESDFTAVPPHFIGKAQISIPLREASEMTLAKIIESARAQLASKLIDCAK